MTSTNQICNLMFIATGNLLFSEMRILVFSDIHGDLESVKTLMNCIRQKQYSVVIFAGDFTSFEDVQERYQKIMEILTCLKAPIYYVYGNRDLPPPKPTYPTYLSQGIKVGIGEGLSITSDANKVDQNTIYVSHKSNLFQRNAFIHIEGHIHMGVKYQNYLNTGFLYRDAYHGAKPLLGCFWELSIQNHQASIQWHNLGDMREVNCPKHSYVSSYVPIFWGECPFCYNKRNEAWLTTFLLKRS